MKRLCFLNSVDFWGGGEKLHLEYALELHRKGYDVIMACRRDTTLWERARSEGLDVYPVKVGAASFLNPIKIKAIEKFFTSRRVDTVIFSTSQDAKVAGIAASRAGVKNIVYLRGLAVPIKGSTLNRYLFKSVFTHVIANSEETKRQVLRHLGNVISDDDVKVIYHGIETDPAKLDHTTELPEIVRDGSGIILGNAGRLTEQKGQRYLIELARILREKGLDFTLYIAGTGELMQELESMINRYDLSSRVKLLGFIDNMEAFMNSIDIFVLSSLWEGFGYVIAEAMIKSKPVVAFDMSSNKEIITHNETGFLVDYPDMVAFAERIIMLDSNPEMREQMGASARESIVERFDALDRITEFEECLLGRKIEIETPA